MSETLAIFGNEYENVAGIKVKNTAGNELTYTLGGGSSSLGTKNITANGTYNASSDNLDGYSSVVVNVPSGGSEWLVKVTDNLHDSSTDVANVYISGSSEASYNGWSATDYIAVKPDTLYLIDKHPGNSYNAFYKSDKTASTSSVTVPNGLSTSNRYALLKTPNDAAFVRFSAATAQTTPIELYEIANQIPSGSLSIVANGVANVSQYDSVNVNVPTGGDAPDLQTKSISFTPTETSQTQTVTPDTGKDGLSSVEVSVGAISSTYVGTGIARKSSTDLTASGATVTVPAGYYSAQASKAVASGSATTPATAIEPTVSITIYNDGLIKANVEGTKSITPTISAGYVSSGTAGTVTVKGVATKWLTTQAATTITPTKTSQTAVPANRYTTGDITVAAIPAAYQDVTGVTATASDVVSGKDIVNSSGTVVHGSLVIQHYYTSVNDPISSDGADGDIWLKVVS